MARDLCDPRLACYGVKRLDAHAMSKGNLVFIVLPIQLFYLFYVYINFLTLSCQKTNFSETDSKTFPRLC